MGAVNLYSLASNLEAGEGPWLSVTAIMCCVYMAWSANRRKGIDDIELTPDQTMRINKVTRQFRVDMEAIINEDKEEKDDEPHS